jgi:integrase
MARRRLAYEHKNPRLLRISFHTIRHWKATTEYHKTKDILHVKSLLGHVSLDNTLIYINLEQALFGESDNQEFHVKVAHNLEEACELIKVGFEYVTEMEAQKIFRKRK